MHNRMPRWAHDLLLKSTMVLRHHSCWWHVCRPTASRDDRRSGIAPKAPDLREEILHLALKSRDPERRGILCQGVLQVGFIAPNWSGVMHCFNHVMGALLRHCSQSSPPGPLSLREARRRGGRQTHVCESRDWLCQDDLLHVTANINIQLAAWPSGRTCRLRRPLRDCLCRPRSGHRRRVGPTWEPGFGA